MPHRSAAAATSVLTGISHPAVHVAGSDKTQLALIGCGIVTVGHTMEVSVKCDPR
ncbi:MAG: hypothetical protein KDN20_25395 [Verrucomicrobiae bacterium]|nr:hypothetical protein [Verrucomicrobiae bacterium]